MRVDTELNQSMAEKKGNVSFLSLVPVLNNPVLAKRSAALVLPLVEVYEGVSGSSKSQVIWDQVQKQFLSFSSVTPNYCNYTDYKILWLF